MNIIICSGRIKRWCKTFPPDGKRWILFRWIILQIGLRNQRKKRWNIYKQFRTFFGKIDWLNKSNWKLG